MLVREPTSYSHLEGISPFIKSRAMFEFDDASSFVMRAQISRETRRPYQELQYRRRSTIDSLRRESSERAQVLSFESDCLPFGTPVLVLAR